MTKPRRIDKERAPWLRLAAAIGAAGVLGSALRKGGLIPTGAAGPDRQHEASGGLRVVVLGAGFAGLAAARSLAKRLPGGAEVLLIDRNNYHLFTPALYQAATMGIDPYDIASPIHRIAVREGVRFRRGEVTGIDIDAKRVQLDNGEVEYNYLIIALGSTTNFFGNRSAREHAFPLKWLHDGVSIRNHILDMLERATVAADAEERKAMLTFAVVGGGATGVEAAAALATVLKRVLRLDFPSLDPSEARVVVIESEGKLLGHMGATMARLALERLRSLGVEVRLNSKALEVGPDCVALSTGDVLAARTTIWTAGVRVPEVVAGLDADHGKGGSLAVESSLRLLGRHDLFAVGDSAHFEDPRSGKSLPLMAAVAVQQGAFVAENVARAIAGEALRPFHYRDLGSVVALGRYSGVAQAGPLVLEGLLGWFAWRLVHLAKITSFRNQLFTAFDWSLNYLHGPDTARIEQPVARPEP